MGVHLGAMETGERSEERKKKKREIRGRRGAAVFSHVRVERGRCIDARGSARTSPGHVGRIRGKIRALGQPIGTRCRARQSRRGDLTRRPSRGLAERKRDRVDESGESRDDTGASRSGRQEGPVSTVRRGKMRAARNADGNGRARSGHTRGDRIDRPNVVAASSATIAVARRYRLIALTEPGRSVARSRCRQRRYHQGIVEKTAETTDFDT